MVYNGTIVQEVRQKYGGWVGHSIRMWKDDNGIEIITTVDTIDVSDNIGKELIVRFSTDIQSQGNSSSIELLYSILLNINNNIIVDMWYTDSMGVEMMERQRNVRSWPFNISEPISWNYVPVNEAAYIQDNNAALRYSFI